ncbi:MAG: glycosyl transferase, partial [Acidobacteriota bacterium]
MADFIQNGSITTLHNLRGRSLEDFEAKLHEWGRERPIALVLPSLFSELEGPALDHIVTELSKATYIRQIIIGLDRADERQFEEAKRFFSRLPQEHHVLWNDGPRLRAIDDILHGHGLAPKEPGKGRNVWYCMGYFLASDLCRSLALHDCDILTYDRSLLAKLIYPIAHPTFTYKFCKGYYFRAGDHKLNGRVTRLLVTPLLRAMKEMFGHHEYLDYIDSFRYPLAGEFSMVWDLVHSIRIPSDWGLEIGVLSEAHRLYSTHRICQVDIADAYDHKHQDLSAGDPERGLSKMSTDICKAFFRKLAITGVVFSPGIFRTLKAAYYRTALDMTEHYFSDADFNGLTLDRHKEEMAIELFTESLMRAGDSFLENPHETPFLPSWNRVVSAVPNVYELLLEAVAA